MTRPLNCLSETSNPLTLLDCPLPKNKEWFKLTESLAQADFNSHLEKAAVPSTHGLAFSPGVQNPDVDGCYTMMDAAGGLTKWTVDAQEQWVLLRGMSSDMRLGGVDGASWKGGRMLNGR